MPSSTLTFRDLQARPVNLPLQRPLATSGGMVSTAPLVLIDIYSEEGIIGSSYVFCYTPLVLGPVTQLLQGLGQTLRGEGLAPGVIERKLRQRFRLLGAQGLTGIALAGIDMALWDALAKQSGLPLVRLLGGEPQAIPAYNSCGLGMIGPERAATEAQELLRAGLRALKVRLGYQDLQSDLNVIHALREALGDEVLLMADYNQSLSVPEALTRIHALDEKGLAWIEEPVAADDYQGHARICQEAKTPVQLGENWWGPHEMSKALDVQACDLVMPDVMKIGGVTGWLRAAALAEAAGIPMSCHLFPEISVHLLAITPTCHYLEYVDWANPILQEPLLLEEGSAKIRDVPGVGLAWKEEAVQQFLYQ